MSLFEQLYKLIIQNDCEGLRKGLEHEPDIVFKQNVNYSSLFMIAAEIGACACVKVLLDGGSEINKKNISGNTALIAAVSYNRFETALYLLESGAEISYRYDKKRISALDLIWFKPNKDKKKWFEVFNPYKNQLDEVDLKHYYENRLIALLK